MKNTWTFCSFAAITMTVLAVGIGPALGGPASVDRAFVLEKSMIIPDVPWGPYSDHMAVDVRGARLFATPQQAHEVAVLDIDTSKVIAVIKNIGNPHGVFFSEEYHRLFVTDGTAGAVKVYDGKHFALIASIPAPGADGLVYDPSTKVLYADYGGDEVGMKYSALAVIDTASLKKIADIRIEGKSLEGPVIDAKNQLLYVNVPDRNVVVVVNLKNRRIVATWHIGQSRNNMAAALDLQHGLLYVGCRDSDMKGSIAVLELSTGKVVARLPIGGWVDSMDYDSRRHRIYASTGTGYLETYQVLPGHVFRQLEPAPTAVMAKTSLYSPQLDREFVLVPHLGHTPEKVMVFRPVDSKSARTSTATQAN